MRRFWYACMLANTSEWCNRHQEERIHLRREVCHDKYTYSTHHRQRTVTKVALDVRKNGDLYLASFQNYHSKGLFPQLDSSSAQPSLKHLGAKTLNVALRDLIESGRTQATSTVELFPAGGTSLCLYYTTLGFHSGEDTTGNNRNALPHHMYATVGDVISKCPQVPSFPLYLAHNGRAAYDTTWLF